MYQDSNPLYLVTAIGDGVTKTKVFKEWHEKLTFGLHIHMHTRARVYMRTYTAIKKINKPAHRATRDGDDISRNPGRDRHFISVIKRHLWLTRRDQNMNIIMCFREMFPARMDDFEWLPNLNGEVADAGEIVRELEPKAVAGWHQFLDNRCFNKLGWATQ